MSLANQPRKQILARWVNAITGEKVGNLVGLPFKYLYGKIAHALGGRPVGDYATLPQQYALNDIYRLVGGAPGNYLFWGESMALANIYATLQGEGTNKGKIARYRELNKDILLALLVVSANLIEAAYDDGVDTGILIYDDGTSTGDLVFVQAA